MFQPKLLGLLLRCLACLQLRINLITVPQVLKYKYKIQTYCASVSAYHSHNCSPRLQLSKCQSEINECWTWRFESFMPRPYPPDGWWGGKFTLIIYIINKCTHFYFRLIKFYLLFSFSIPHLALFAILPFDTHTHSHLSRSDLRGSFCGLFP